MTRPYFNLPHTPTIPVEPFEVPSAPREIADLKQLLRLSRVPKETYENRTDEVPLGLKRDWVVRAKEAWEGAFDWPAQAKRLNSIPHYLARVTHPSRGTKHTIHFIGLLSTSATARPILFLHGWPGCFFEFLPMLELVRKTYTEQELPYHLIVPSLPGWMWSDPPPIDAEWDQEDSTALFGELMHGLGFKEYATQGGDLGAWIAAALGERGECKVVHLNFRSVQSPPKGIKAFEAMQANPQPPDPSAMIRMMAGFSPQLVNANKPATLGMAVGCNPLSLLVWLGDAYALWPHKPLPLDDILTIVTLFWLTDTYPSCMYQYRYLLGPRAPGASHALPPPSGDSGAQGTADVSTWISCPFGYSFFEHDVHPTPVDWVEQTGNMVWSATHEEGGHFAALEEPAVFWEDVKGCIEAGWGLEKRRQPTD